MRKGTKSASLITFRSRPGPLDVENILDNAKYIRHLQLHGRVPTTVHYQLEVRHR